MEIWKQTIECKYYLVSNLGRIKSLKGIKERFLKKQIHKDGYEFVNLYIDGKQYYRNVHRLVAESFLNHNSNGKLEIVVDHINNIQSDNRLCNLQLITQRLNCSKDKKGSSKYTGVYFNKDSKEWRSQIWNGTKTKNLGCFENEYDAHLAYQNALANL